MRPDFHISGLSSEANDRLLSVTVTESTQGSSDSATFTLDDRDYLLEVPTKGKIITVQMGYKETGLINVGEFTVDQIRHKDGQAASFEITARAQKHRDAPVKVRVVRPWDESTLFTIINKIAGRSGYSAKVDPAVATFFYDHLDQNESDAQFLQRLAVLHDCYVKYENNQLVFWKRDNTVGDITVSRGAGGTTGVSLTATSSCRNEYTGVKASWHNRDVAETFYELAGTDGAMCKILPRTYTNKAQAMAAAASEFSRLCRGTGSIESLTIQGDANIRAGRKLHLTGFRPEYCRIDWVITEVSHNISSVGFQTTLKAEADTSRKIDGSTTSLSEEKIVQDNAELARQIYTKATILSQHPKKVIDGIVGTEDNNDPTIIKDKN